MAIIDVTYNGSSGRQLYNDGTTLNDATRLNALFNYNEGDSENDEYFFPNGTYLIPPDYSFDFGTRPINFRGETREGVILTTFDPGGTNISMRCPEQIDITKPKPTKDGMYQVETIGTLHSDYTGLTLNIGSYVQILSGTPSVATLLNVKTANYVTYLDANDAPSFPLYDGLYIIQKEMPGEISGGYPYSEIQPNGNDSMNKLKVIIGSVIKYDSTGPTDAKWSIFQHTSLNPYPIAFSSQSEIYFENISFVDFAPFVFSPYGEAGDRALVIKNCYFKFCTRISAFELTGNGGSIGAEGDLHIMLPPGASSLYVVPTKVYGFKSMQYISNSFEYIHQSIVWGTPSTHDFIIKDNRFANNFSTLAYFVLIGGTANGTSVRRNFNYLIDGNSFTSCRISSANSNDSTILFQFYDNARFINNTFIDCTGIHCYNSGDNTIIDSNVMEPYINPDLPGGESLYLYKNQNVGSQQVFSNNVVDGCVVTLLHTKQTGKITAAGNNLRMSPSANYVFASTTGTLSKKLFYYAVSASNFTTLAGGGSNVGTISNGDRVYWEARENKWLAIPSYTNQPAFEMDTSEDPAYTASGDPGLDILNNRIHADIVLKVDRPVRIVEISGNVITGISQFLINTRFLNTIPDPDEPGCYLQNLVIKNNPLIEIIAGTDGNNFIVDKDLLIENNTILHTYLSWLHVHSHKGNITINNNYFDSKTDFPENTPSRGGLIGIGGLMSVNNTVYPNLIEDVTIKGNVMNVRDVTNSAIRILDAENIYISDNIINDYLPNPGGNQESYLALINSRDPDYYLDGELRIKRISITNNNVSFTTAREGRYIFGSLTSSGQYIGELLTICNNYSVGPYPPIQTFVPNISIITFADFVLSSHSWDNSLQITSAIGFTCDPALADLTYVLNFAPFIGTFTITLPTTFLQNKQKITFTTIDSGIPSPDFAFSGGTVMYHDNAFAARSSLTLSYNKSDDTWYVVEF